MSEGNDKNIRWDDIIFQDREKLYGAYYIKEKYPRTVLVGLLIALLFISIPTVLLYLHYHNYFGTARIYSKTISLNYISMNDTLFKYLVNLPQEELKKEEVSEDSYTVTDSADIKEQTIIQDMAGDTVEEDQEGIEVEPSSGSGFFGTETVASYVEEMPQFPGGIRALSAFIMQNTVYPEFAIRNNIYGTVYVSFVIDKFGQLGRIKVIRPIHPVLDSAAVEVIRKMPLWQPGRQDSHNVDVALNLPINFNKP